MRRCLFFASALVVLWTAGCAAPPPAGTEPAAGPPALSLDASPGGGWTEAPEEKPADAPAAAEEPGDLFAPVPR